MVEIEKYPALFHKYLLKISNVNDSVNYEVNSNLLTSFKKYICHIHIYDLSKFHFYFGNIVPNLQKDFTIIITYCLGNYNSSDIDKIYIKINNKGYDIGGKICMIDYINQLDIDYEYILFLHSKSDRKKRERYFDCLMSRMPEIIKSLENKDVLGVFPNTIWINHNGIKNFRSYDLYKNNERYLDELFDYLGCKNKIKVFAEGNCMILHKKVIDYIFKDNCRILYNILNSDNSFDYNWFITNYKYKVNNESVKDVLSMYNEYINKGLFGNNNGLKNSASSHPDGMVEHVFERLWINIVLELGGICLVSDTKGIFNLNDLIIK